MNGYRSSLAPKRLYAAAVVTLLVVTCSEMETKWTREIDVLGPGNYRVNSICSIKDEIYVMGTYWQDDKDSRCFTTKHDADGLLDWFTVFESPGIEQAAGIHIIASMTSTDPLDASSEVYGLIRTRDTNGHQGIVLARYDTLGNTDWQNTVISSEGTLDATLLSDHVGNLYVAGWERDIENKANVYVGKYNESGDVAWFTKYYTEQIDFSDLKYDMMRSNCLLMAGVLTSSEELFYMKYDGSGQFMGYTIHEGPGVSELADIKIDPNGYVYITASINRPETGEDYITIAYDNNDNLLWASRYDGTVHRNDKPKAIAVDESLNVYVAGTSENMQGLPVVTVVKYDSAGSPIWTANLPRNHAAELFMMQPRYIPMGRYDDARHLYVAGTAGEKAFIARCNLQGVFSWTDEYGKIHMATKPTAMSGHVLAIQSIEDGKSWARILKFGPSTVAGLARWD
jgi:hypothetical protein